MANSLMHSKIDENVYFYLSTRSAFKFVQTLHTDLTTQ